MTRSHALAAVLALSLLLEGTAGCASDPVAEPVDASSDVPMAPVIDAGDASHDARLPGDAGDGGAPVGPRDRAGRAFVTRLLVSEANRDAYNQSPAPFTLLPGIKAEADIAANLARLDALDGKVDWPFPDGGAHPLVALVLTDALVVDPRMPFSPNGYLEIESSGAAHATSGGRALDDDALGKTLSFFVKGQRAGVSGGTAVPRKPASRTFPYLLPPH